MNPFAFFLLTFKASLFSTGGLGNVPSLHNDLIDRGFTTEARFTEALAVGQISPGPNGLWVVSLGYLVGGVRGSLVAICAASLPAFLVLLWQKLYERVHHHPFVEGFMRGLSLAVVGIFAFVLYKLFLGTGANAGSITIFVCSALLAYIKKLPILVLLSLAGFAGILFMRSA